MTEYPKQFTFTVTAEHYEEAKKAVERHNKLKTVAATVDSYCGSCIVAIALDVQFPAFIFAVSSADNIAAKCLDQVEKAYYDADSSTDQFQKLQRIIQTFDKAARKDEEMLALLPQTITIERYR